MAKKTLSQTFTDIANSVRKTAVSKQRYKTYTPEQMVSELNERASKDTEERLVISGNEVLLTGINWSGSGVFHYSILDCFQDNSKTSVHFDKCYLADIRTGNYTPNYGTIPDLGGITGFNLLCQMRGTEINNLFGNDKVVGFFRNVRELDLGHDNLLTFSYGGSGSAELNPVCYSLETDFYSRIVVPSKITFTLSVGNAQHLGYLSITDSDDSQSPYLDRGTEIFPYLKLYLRNIRYSRAYNRETAREIVLDTPVFNVTKDSYDDYSAHDVYLLGLYDRNSENGDTIKFIGPGSGTAVWGTGTVGSLEDVLANAYHSGGESYPSEPLIIFEGFDSVDWDGARYTTAGITTQPLKYKEPYERYRDNAIIGKNPDGSLVYASDLLPDSSEISWDEGSGS